MRSGMDKGDHPRPLVPVPPFWTPEMPVCARLQRARDNAIVDMWVVVQSSCEEKGGKKYRLCYEEEEEGKSAEEVISSNPWRSSAAQSASSPWSRGC